MGHILLVKLKKKKSTYVLLDLTYSKIKKNVFFYDFIHFGEYTKEKIFYTFWEYSKETILYILGIH